MAFPDALRPLMGDREFWSDFLREDVYRKAYPTLGNRPSGGFFFGVDLPITPTFRLCLQRWNMYPWFDLYLINSELEARRESWRECYDVSSGPLRLPHWLRWEELDLFGRCLALRDPEWPHPGPLVLFLSFAAPVTCDQDATFAFPLLEGAWGALGLFTGRRLDRILRRQDRRLIGTDSRQEPYGWQLDDGAPPCDAWGRFVDEAGRCCREVVHPGLLARHPSAAAIAAAAGEGDSTAAPVLADALEEGGVTDPTILASLRSAVPARVAWVLEMLLGMPSGDLVRRLGTPVPSPSPVHAVDFQVPDKDVEWVARQIRRALIEQGVGEMDLGLARRGFASPGVVSYRVNLFGPLHEGVEALREIVAHYIPPLRTQLFMVDDDAPHASP